MLEKIAILISSLLGHLSAAQEPLPQNYFRSPIDTVILLAGNFGELRPNHFHAGIDIKTNNREGMPVHAAAEGFVSRIKISSFGYGKVIYVTHPNGFVTVYGHLRSFNDSIGTYIKRQQYAQKAFEIELFPKATDFPVKKGEVIAFSGNTGNSGGPHIHFEIRDEKTEKAINPLLFGLPVTDTKKPQVTRVKIYPGDAGGLINGVNKEMEFRVKMTKLGYTLVLTEPLRVSGSIYFGLEAFDTEIAGGGKNGIFSAALYINNLLLNYRTMDRIGFDESRAINSFIDYPDYIKTGHFTQRSYVEPNNKLDIYKYISNKGLAYFNSDSTFTVKYILKDVSGNTSILEFPLVSRAEPARTTVKKDTLPVFKFGVANSFGTDNFKISMPANVLYDDILFQYSCSKNKLYGCFSQVHQVHSALVPVHDLFTISILQQQVSDSIKRHLFIARINKSGHKEYIGGIWEGNFITAKIKEFGDYVIASDTVPPVIQAISRLEFKISDNFSGIKNFEAYIDNKWVLMEYEYKQNKLFYTLDRSPGFNPLDSKTKHHVLKLSVTDKAGNTKTYTGKFGI